MKRTTHQYTKLITSAAFALAAIVAVTASPVQAGEEDQKDTKAAPPLEKAPREPKFWISVGGGADFDMHGPKWINDGRGTIMGQPATIESRSFAAVHDQPVLGKVEIGYDLNPVVSFFGGFSYEHAYTDNERIGRVHDTAGVFGTPGANYNLTANVDDYNGYAGVSGIKLALPLDRMFPGTHIPIRPYLSASAGGKYVEGTNVQLYTGGNETLVGDPRLFRSSWIFTTAVSLGTEFVITKNISLGVEGGLGFDSGLRSTRGPFDGTFTGSNDYGDRLYFPVTGYAKVKF